MGKGKGKRSNENRTRVEPPRETEPADGPDALSHKKENGRMPAKEYSKQLFALHVELVKLQQWVQAHGIKVCVVFEGRDGAGKGGAIKALTERVSPRVFRVIALPAPTDREKSQMYVQRYMAHFPSGGEVVLFDRSWYNRAGVERVMGFCTEPEYQEFMRSCPEFERMLVRSGVQLVKYWFSVSDEEQERRFQARVQDPMRRWKLSPMDLESRARWVEYSRAKDVMLKHTDRPKTPWHIVDADNKKKARLNCIAHLLEQIPYDDVAKTPVILPARVRHADYERHPVPREMYVPERY